MRAIGIKSRHFFVLFATLIVQFIILQHYSNHHWFWTDESFAAINALELSFMGYIREIPAREMLPLCIFQ